MGDEREAVFGDRSKLRVRSGDGERWTPTNPSGGYLDESVGIAPTSRTYSQLNGGGTRVLLKGATLNEEHQRWLRWRVGIVSQQHGRGAVSCDTFPAFHTL
ncbi:hypothetical protein OPV22_025868 [Ensete ventricosum]|uniref:Uncharacterized protein n=1 Tax=Ensete ventricosum TaxID=4639 RepID=A0AAV8P8J0_ENSVE|nr:hypothetical protein OPV22_025868 [Ensete ventricosum]